jgi:hypothetical protein
MLPIWRMQTPPNLKSLTPVLLAALSSVAWGLPGSTLLAPAASLLLVVAVTLAQSSLQRFLTALAYYAVGSASMVGAVTGYWGSDHAAIGVLAWVATSTALATPWALASGWRGALAALILTALPPLGLIGWLSPLAAAGVLFPGMGWAGLTLLLAVVVCIAKSRIAWLAPLGAIALAANLVYTPPALPLGWVGVDTSTQPARGSVLAAIQNNQAIIATALEQGHGAQLVILPEAVIDGWLPGTRRQFAAAVPPGQLWLVGAQTRFNSVLAVTHGNASVKPLIHAAALLPGGNWSPGGLQPAWWQTAPVVEGKRVWASVCVEQVLPWTWLEAMTAHPDVVLAISNQWWASPTSSAPRIQAASTSAWARLLGVPVVSAINR